MTIYRKTKKKCFDFSKKKLFIERLKIPLQSNKCSIKHLVQCRKKNNLKSLLKSIIHIHPENHTPVKQQQTGQVRSLGQPMWQWVWYHLAWNPHLTSFVVKNQHMRCCNTKQKQNHDFCFDFEGPITDKNV